MQCCKNHTHFMRLPSPGKYSKALFCDFEVFKEASILWLWLLSEFCRSSSEKRLEGTLSDLFWNKALTFIHSTSWAPVKRRVHFCHRNLSTMTQTFFQKTLKSLGAQTCRGNIAATVPHWSRPTRCSALSLLRTEVKEALNVKVRTTVREWRK